MQNVKGNVKIPFLLFSVCNKFHMPNFINVFLKFIKAESHYQINLIRLIEFDKCRISIVESDFLKVGGFKRFD